MDTLKILISGISAEMRPERDTVTRAIESLRLDAARVEIAFSDEHVSREQALHMTRACDIYLGLFARTRYGLPITADGRSLAELEFNEAQELKKPLLVFIKSLAPDELEDPRQRAFILRVLDPEAKAHVTEFESLTHLEDSVAGALMALLSEAFGLHVTHPPFQAPRDLDTFVGREAQIKELTDALTHGNQQTVLLHGVSDFGGLGKTELAVHIAHRLRDVFRDGILWADVPTTRSAETLVVWARQYGGFEVLGRRDLRFEFRPLPPEARRIEEITVRSEEARRVLGGKRILAILDGVMDERDDEKIAPLLHALNDCAVLVTSRTRQLRSLKNARAIRLDPLSEDEACDLFARVAGDERLSNQRALVVKIARVVDLLPLALNLAAVQLREYEDWTLETLLEMLGVERERLEATQWGYEKARGMRAAINLSYAHLDASAKRFFSMLGIFGGEDFDVRAAAYVTETATTVAGRTLERLTALSLVQERRRAGRYRLHRLLRDYAREKLYDPAESAGQRPAAEERMATYYCVLAKEHGRKLQGPEIHNALAILDTEVSNIFAGQKWAQARNNRSGWELCRDYIHGAMTYYFSLHAMWSDWITWSNAGIEACRKLGDEKSAVAIAGSLGMVYHRKGDWKQATEFFLHAIATMEKYGDLRGLATIHMNLGNVQTEKGEWQQAITSYARSLQLRERLGDMHGMAQTRANMGILYAKHGERDKARANWLQALEMFDHLGKEHEADIVRNWLKGSTTEKGEKERTDKGEKEQTDKGEKERTEERTDKGEKERTVRSR